MNQVSCKANTAREVLVSVISWIRSLREASLLCRLWTFMLAAMLQLRYSEAKEERS